jgi:hypothetical protein
MIKTNGSSDRGFEVETFPRFTYKSTLMLKTSSIGRFCLHPAQFWHRSPYHTFYRTLLYSRGSIRKTLLGPVIHQFSTQRYPQTPPDREGHKPTIRENIYTLPNILTVSRILACPVLGWSILEGNFHFATTLLVYAGLTDLVCLCISEQV